MSSAALQAVPHQPTALAAAPLQPPSSHQYASSHPHPHPPTNESYHAHQSGSATPSSRRPPSRKTSANGASSPFDPSLMPQRASRSSRQSSAPPDRYANMPPVAPPRTSSTQQPGTARRNNYPSERNTRSSHHATPDNASSGAGGDSNGAADTRSRKATTAHVPNDSPGRSSNARDPKYTETSMPIRTANNDPSYSRSSREASENLMRAVSGTGEPSSRPTRGDYRGSSPPDDDVAAGALVVGTSSAQEERRATRTRHDHERSHKGTSKLGDFILGSTIGEGEFGKVKLGWKHDNTSVQVCLSFKARKTVPRSLISSSVRLPSS